MNSPEQIAENFIEVGVKKTSLSAKKMFLLGIFAGVFIALAGAGSTIASATITNGSLARLINGMIFPSGLAMVILAGSELFTGNSLIVISVLEKRVSFKMMLKNWLIVYLGNLVGSLLVAFIFVYGHLPNLFAGGLVGTLVNGAITKVSLTMSEAFLRGVLCNVLVCIAVWMAAAAKEAHGKVVALYLPILVFVVCGFEHCVANMFSIPVGILTSYEYAITSEGLTWFNFFVHNLLPVTLGNIVGGCAVGAGYWAVYLKNNLNK